MNYWRLRIEGGPIFRRLLKSQLGTVGVWVACDSGNRIAIGGRVEIQLLIRQNILSSERSSSLTSLSPWRLCRNDENAALVILNKVKNLMHSIRYTKQILRLPPQNDITTQSLAGETFYETCQAPF